MEWLIHLPCIGKTHHALKRYDYIVHSNVLFDEKITKYNELIYTYCVEVKISLLQNGEVYYIAKIQSWNR